MNIDISTERQNKQIIIETYVKNLNSIAKVLKILWLSKWVKIFNLSKNEFNKIIMI